MNGKAKRHDFKIIELRWNYNIAAGQGASTNFKTLVDASLPDGCRFIGIQGFATNNMYVFVINCLYGDSQYTLYLRNISTSNQSGTASVYILATNQ